jgi:transposase-like protein
MNNIIEQDHRSIIRITNFALGFKSFDTATITIGGIEVFQMIKKNQIKGILTVQQEVKFIERLFMIA